jgi:hypothetical protein
VVVPVQQRTPVLTSPPGALVLRISDGSITQAGFIRQPAAGGSPQVYSPIERSLVIGDMLWTVSGTGLLASGLGTLRPQTWIAFL